MLPQHIQLTYTSGEGILYNTTLRCYSAQELRTASISREVLQCTRIKSSVHQPIEKLRVRSRSIAAVSSLQSIGFNMILNQNKSISNKAELACFPPSAYSLYRSSHSSLASCRKHLHTKNISCARSSELCMCIVSLEPCD